MHPRIQRALTSDYLILLTIPVVLAGAWIVNLLRKNRSQVGLWLLFAGVLTGFYYG